MGERIEADSFIIDEQERIKSNLDWLQKRYNGMKLKYKNGYYFNKSLSLTEDRVNRYRQLLGEHDE